MRIAHTREAFFRARHEPATEDEADFRGFEDHLDLQGIDALIERHGFAKARGMIAERMCERAQGRPVVIDHIQEPH